MLGLDLLVKRAADPAPPEKGRRGGQQVSPMGRVLAEIRTMLAREELAPGDQLPSETELAARFGVARASVREALALLERDGVVNVRQGHGRFVSALAGLTVSSPITVFESVTEMLGERGLSLATRVLSVDRGRATRTEMQSLGIAAGDDVVRLRRVRTGDGYIVIYSENAFPASVLGARDIADVDFAGSVTELLAAAGRRPVSSAAHIRAATLPPEVAERPEAGSRQAWLSIEEVCIDGSGIPVLHSVDYHRGDLFSFHVLRRRGSNNDNQ
jgi:GntR family transcriptional regulator